LWYYAILAMVNHREQYKINNYNIIYIDFQESPLYKMKNSQKSFDKIQKTFMRNIYVQVTHHIR
jgi:hypothetical protein